jgi:hypothetical protein
MARRKTLYYTVEPEIEFIDEFEGCLTGNKTVSVYDIVNNKPVNKTNFEMTLEDTSLEAVAEWADEVYDGKKFNFVLL